MWTIALTSSSAVFKHHSTWYTSPSKFCLDRSVPYSRNVRIAWACKNFASGSSGSPSRSWQRFRTSPVARLFQHFRWTPIPLALALAYVAYQQFRHVHHKREASGLTGGVKQASQLEVCFYKMLPLRAASRWWGWFNSLELPSWLRAPLIRLFIAAYGCDLSEAACEELKHYHNLGEFFRRELKPSVRPIHPGECVVSPADGTVLHFGKVENGHAEQVKGISYSLRCFLGPNTWNDGCSTETQRNLEKNLASDQSYHESLLSRGKSESDLYHCIVYLAPGDYHRFHSPADWNIMHRRHFPGELLSVRPGMASWFAGLFNVNERVVYYGKWKHGFFSMAAVGATNVGSIKVYFDKQLVTNTKHYIRGTYHDHSFRVNNNSSGVEMAKGDPFGEFNLGSTMVLLFEAPKGCAFSLKPGQKIKYGELLSTICRENKESLQEDTR